MGTYCNFLKHGVSYYEELPWPWRVAMEDKDWVPLTIIDLEHDFLVQPFTLC